MTLFSSMRQNDLTWVDLKIFQRHWAGYLANVLQNLFIKSCVDTAHAPGLSLCSEEIYREKDNFTPTQAESIHRKAASEEEELKLNTWTAKGQFTWPGGVQPVSNV